MNKTRNGKLAEVGKVREKAGLISYLARLGLGDDDLAEVVSLLRSPGAEQPATEEVLSRFERAPAGFERVPAQVFEDTAAKQTIRLYLAEEQQILREAYRSFLGDHDVIVLLGYSGDTSAESLVGAATALKPNVMLLGVKSVNADTVEKLDMLREACPKVGIVLLFASSDIQGMRALRQFSGNATVGCAYLPKHTIDTADQLTQVIFSAAEGRITVDPRVMEELIRNGDAQGGFLNELSPRELEVLSWIAKGYRNETIANVLGRDVKTVERHINNIYGKLGATEDSDSRDRRVGAALTYLRATGLLHRDHIIED